MAVAKSNVWVGAIIAVLAALAVASVITFWKEPVAEEEIHPRLRLPSVQTDADDCAIWVHPTDPTRSLIIGNDKEGDHAGIYAYDFSGRVLQFISLNRPSAVDVRRGISLGGRSVDLCVVLERDISELKAFAIDPETLRLTDVTSPRGIPTGIQGRSHGMALYRRPRDGALFAFVSPRGRGPLSQIELLDDGSGHLTGRVVRRLGDGVIRSMAEAMAADDERGFLYVADESRAVLKFRAEPDAPPDPVATFATGDGIVGDREGIAIYKKPDATGYIIVQSQGDNTLKVYAREGDNRFLATLRPVEAVRSDALEATSAPIGEEFPEGLVVCHSSPAKSYFVYSWADLVRGKLKSALAKPR